MDLLIVDVPDNLLVPRISNPSSSVLVWNMVDVDDFVETLFAFTVQHLSDDGAILLFLPQSSSVRKNVFGWGHAYGYIQYKDWLGINELRLSSNKDHQRTILILNLTFISCVHSKLIPCFLDSYLTNPFFLLLAIA